MSITTIGIPPQPSVLGPPPNFDKVTKIGTGFSAASNTPGSIGSYFTFPLRIALVANSQTSLVLDSFKATGRMRVVNVEYGAQAVTATASFLVYNATQAVNVIEATTPSTTAAYTSTITTPIIEKDDIVQLLGTTNGSGALTNLSVNLTVQYIGAPANAQSA